MILLSNIYDYTSHWKENISTFLQGQEEFKAVINNLKPHLIKNGQLQFEYVWEDIHSHCYAISQLLNLKNTYVIENPRTDAGFLMYSPDGIPENNFHM